MWYIAPTKKKEEKTHLISILISWDMKAVRIAYQNTLHNEHKTDNIISRLTVSQVAQAVGNDYLM